MGRVRESIAEYYDRRGVLPELEEGAIEFSLRRNCAGRSLRARELAVCRTYQSSSIRRKS